MCCFPPVEGVLYFPQNALYRIIQLQRRTPPVPRDERGKVFVPSRLPFLVRPIYKWFVGKGGHVLMACPNRN